MLLLLMVLLFVAVRAREQRHPHPGCAVQLHAAEDADGGGDIHLGLGRARAQVCAVVTSFADTAWDATTVSLARQTPVSGVIRHHVSSRGLAAVSRRECIVGSAWREAGHALSFRYRPVSCRAF